MGRATYLRILQASPHLSLCSPLPLRRIYLNRGWNTGDPRATDFRETIRMSAFVGRGMQVRAFVRCSNNAREVSIANRISGMIHLIGNGSFLSSYRQIERQKWKGGRERDNSILLHAFRTRDFKEIAGTLIFCVMKRTTRRHDMWKERKGQVEEAGRGETQIYR